MASFVLEMAHGKVATTVQNVKSDLTAKTSDADHTSLHHIHCVERFHLALDEFGTVMDVSHSGQRKKGLVATSG